MRLLADENIPKLSVDWLREQGNDVVWAGTDCDGSSDAALLDLAEDEARILLTLDKDFVQIALQRREPLIHAGVVLLRVHPATRKSIAPLVRAFIHAEAEWKGHVSTIAVQGIQIGPSRIY